MPDAVDLPTPTPRCAACRDTGYVCERHPERPWDGLVQPSHGCGCDGAVGMPCPVCCAAPLPTHTADGRLILHRIDEAFTPTAKRRQPDA